MALTKDEKNAIVSDVTGLLESSKLTVVATYTGTTVKALQQLRRTSRENGTQVRVVKNRLVIKALGQVDTLKGADTAALTGQLLYAFNADDEVAPAQTLAKFAKDNPNLAFVGAITADGNFIGADDVKVLAALPSKDQLRGQLVGTLAAPLTGFMRVLNGNLTGFLYALEARADAIK
jgi:large subunit ribosomal protein L10